METATSEHKSDGTETAAQLSLHQQYAGGEQGPQVAHKQPRESRQTRPSSTSATLQGAVANHT